MSLITPDIGLLFWMTLIFAIVFFILARFGFPLITGMVDRRSERINASIAKAKEAEEKLSSLAEEQNRLVEQARLEQGRILKETSEMRAEMLAKAREEASEEAGRMIADAKQQIANEKEAALRDIRREVALVSVGVAEKIIRKQLDNAVLEKDLLDRLVDEASRVEND